MDEALAFRSYQLAGVPSANSTRFSRQSLGPETPALMRVRPGSVLISNVPSSFGVSCAYIAASESGWTTFTRSAAGRGGFAPPASRTNRPLSVDFLTGTA